MLRRLVGRGRQRARGTAVERSEPDVLAVRPARRVVGHDVRERAAVRREARRSLGRARRGERPHASRWRRRRRKCWRSASRRRRAGPCARTAMVFPSGDQSIASGPPGSNAPHRESRREKLAGLAPARRVGRHPNEPEPTRPVVVADHPGVVLLLLAPLVVRVGPVGGDVRDPPSVGRPGGLLHVRRGVGQARGLAARGGEEPDVDGLLAALGEKRDPLPVGRPARPRRRRLAERGRPGLAPVGRREPDLRAVLAAVRLHHRLPHDVGGPPAVRRDPDVGDRPVLEGLERRPTAGIVRGRGDSAGENRQREPAERALHSQPRFRNHISMPPATATHTAQKIG